MSSADIKVERVRLTREGYDANTGRYFGEGGPVFYIYGTFNGANVNTYIRSADYQSARTFAKRRYAGATVAR
jgi:hypothetical protein